MAYKCLECGHIFEEGEQARWRESRGEYWGTPCYEEMSGCPLCKGSFEETVRCEICGAEHLDGELNGGVCDECIKEYSHDAEMCKKISTGHTETIEIDAFLASVFEVADIEQILMDFIRERKPDIDCSAFIDGDEYWFGERLAEEVKKIENEKN